MSRTPLREALLELGYKFHGVLIRAARNAALRDHIATCMRRIAPVRTTSMEMVRNMQTAYAEHARLLKAILDGDAAEAERIMIEHVALRAEQAKDLVAGWKTRRVAASKLAKKPSGRDDATLMRPARRPTGPHRRTLAANSGGENNGASGDLGCGGQVPVSHAVAPPAGHSRRDQLERAAEGPCPAAQSLANSDRRNARRTAGLGWHQRVQE